MAYEQTQYWDRAELRRRGIGIALTLLLEALLIFAILSLGMRTGAPAQRNRGLSTFSLEAASQSPKTQASTDTAVAIKTAQRNVIPVIPKPILPPVNPVKLPPPNPDFIKVSKADFDAMDLSKFPVGGGKGSGEGSGSGNGSGNGGKGVMGPGAGPGGAQLFPVAWYREPTDAELSPYLAAVKRIPPGASADIACRMIDHYHVENCQILNESPRGTGLAKALRLAAWQFLVRPPRVDNKPQLGVWVRIHFDFSTKAAEAVEESAP